MTTFPADDPDKVPFAGILPAAPKPFILGNGEGEKSLVFDQLFSILLSADETDDQYGAFTMVGRARAGGPEILVYVPPEVQGQPVATGGSLTVESRSDGSRLMHLAPAGGYSLTVRPAALALMGC